MKIVYFVVHVFFLLTSLVSNSQDFNVIESAEYDPVYHRFLVSNSDGVMVVDSDGEPLAEMGGDAVAQYGMEVVGNTLFTIVNDDVRAYDLTSGLEISSVTIDGAQFLNGMASDGDHRIWVTDFSAKDIFEIDFTDLANPTYIQIVSNTGTTPNGICYDETNNRLVFVSWGPSAAIKTVDLTDYSISELVANTGVGNIDGIDNDDYGNYYIASWSPNRIMKYNEDFSVSEIITVAGGLSSPADIAYAEEIDTLVIPNSANNTVRFVGFQTSGIRPSEENPFAFSCYPNPVNESSVIYFTLAQPGVTTISILDSQGKLVKNFWNENLPATAHRFVLGDLDLSPGNYIWHIQSNGVTHSSAFVKP
jgi:sugar lactone lactonase YvrE